MSQFLKFAPYADVLDAIGCKSAIAASSWIDRYNQRHPSRPIRRLHGKVCVEDLQAAVTAEIERRARTPASRQDSRLRRVGPNAG
jgi:hypothetical protein